MTFCKRSLAVNIHKARYPVFTPVPEPLVGLIPFLKTMEPINLYVVPPSPPCRAVITAAKYMKIDVNLKYVNLMAGNIKCSVFVVGLFRFKKRETILK